MSVNHVLIASLQIHCGGSKNTHTVFSRLEYILPDYVTKKRLCITYVLVHKAL